MLRVRRPGEPRATASEPVRKLRYSGNGRPETPNFTGADPEVRRLSRHPQDGGGPASSNENRAAFIHAALAKPSSNLSSGPPTQLVRGWDVPGDPAVPEVAPPATLFISLLFNSLMVRLFSVVTASCEATFRSYRLGLTTVGRKESQLGGTWPP